MKNKRCHNFSFWPKYGKVSIKIKHLEFRNFQLSDFSDFSDKDIASLKVLFRHMLQNIFTHSDVGPYFLFSTCVWTWSLVLCLSTISPIGITTQPLNSGTCLKEKI